MSKQIIEKVEAYLRKQFPKRRLIRYVHLNGKGAELYGFGSIPIKVVDMGAGKELFYQIMTKQND